MRRARAGFTLVEIIIVMAIVLLVAAISIGLPKCDVRKLTGAVSSLMPLAVTRLVTISPHVRLLRTWSIIQSSKSCQRR